jgi:hypothetical protein
MGRAVIHAPPLVHPTDDVVAVIEDAPRADSTISALHLAGFTEADIHVFRGRDEIGALAVAWLRRSDLPTFLTPILATVLDDGRKVQEIYDAYALAGHVVVAVHTRNVDDVDEATRVLRDNGARDTWYFGRWTKAAP